MADLPRLNGMPSTTSQAQTTTTLALKEWAAVAHALLDGRQTILLRKGGIHEKAFAVGEDRFVLFPTVAHSHVERVRAEHHDVLEMGAGDVDEANNRFVVRCGISLVEVVPVDRPERLDRISDLHIWTGDSIRKERLEFRPKKVLQILVVRAFELPEPVTLERLPDYGGCKSWVDLPLAWDGTTGRQVHTEARLAADATRVRAAVSLPG